MTIQRNKTLDLAKGIAISLMVIGHCYSGENYVLCVIYAFHMPFFFIVSGILYGERWSQGITFEFKKTAKKLLVPYYLAESLFAAFLSVLSKSDNVVKTFSNYLFHSIMPLVGVTATWFLPCMLITLCLFVLISKLIRNEKVQICVFSALFLVGLVFPSPPRVLVPLLRSFIGIGFFTAGYFGRVLFQKKSKPISLFITAIVFFVLACKNGQVSLVELNFSNPFLYVLNSILGSYLLLQVCLRVPQARIPQFFVTFSIHSSLILCAHVFLIEIGRLVDYKILGSLLGKLKYSEGIVFGGIVLMIMYFVILILDYLQKGRKHGKYRCPGL